MEARNLFFVIFKFERICDSKTRALIVYFYVQLVDELLNEVWEEVFSHKHFPALVDLRTESENIYLRSIPIPSRYHAAF